MKTLHSPFNVAEQRLKKYTAVTLLVPIAILVYVTQKDYEKQVSQFEEHDLQKGSFVTDFKDWIMPTEIIDLYNFRLC